MHSLKKVYMRNKSIIYLVLLIPVLFICLSFKINNVKALETFYENMNGVTLTKEEYDFLSQMYWDGYQSLMTLDDYEEFKNSKVMNGQIEVKKLNYNNYIVPYGTSISYGGRTLKIFKSCSSNCLISVTLEWTGNPTVRSYDVIGAYIENTSFTNTPTTTVATSSSKTVVTDLKKTNNGIGSSFKLPSGSNIKVNQTFRVNTGGHVYASYQHAKSSSTLAKSKDYTFSKFGYGNVFQFSNNSSNIYDAMSGVDITV